MIERLNKLKNDRGRFANNSELAAAFVSDIQFKQEVETLYKHYFSKPLRGCQNCFCDGYHELINLKQERIMEKSKCEFKLRAGALLQDRRSNQDKYRCTNVNLTNDLALYHLKTNPSCEKLFDKMPADWKEQVANYLLEGESRPATVTIAEANKKIEKIEKYAETLQPELTPEPEAEPEAELIEAIAIEKIKVMLASKMKKADIETAVKAFGKVGEKEIS